MRWANDDSFFLIKPDSRRDKNEKNRQRSFFSYKPFFQQLQRKSRFVVHHLQVAVMWEAPNRGGMQQRPHPPQHSAPKKSPNKGNLWQSTAFFENTYSYKTCQIHSIDLEIRRKMVGVTLGAFRRILGMVKLYKNVVPGPIWTFWYIGLSPLPGCLWQMKV